MLNTKHIRLQFISAVVLISLPVISTPASAAFCARWSTPSEIGQLPLGMINEASGLAVSKIASDRLYWINDSGDKGAFYFTKTNGTGATKVKVEGLKPRDTEALGYGDCPEGPCLAIADIGDNRSRRKDIHITFILDQINFPKTVKPLAKLVMQYPDGARDAEAFAILPSGDLLVVSKALSLPSVEIKSASVYILAKEFIRKSGTQTLKKIGELPVPEWSASDGILGKLVTDVSVNTRRQVLGILTYSRVIEIPLAKMTDLSNVAQWKSGNDYSLIPFKALGQQESLAYSHDSDRLTWSTEYMPTAAPIFSMTCEASQP